jgi:hypothetical protein
MIVLHEFVRQTHGFELIRAKNFHEESALVLKNLRSEDANLA